MYNNVISRPQWHTEQDFIENPIGRVLHSALSSITPGDYPLDRHDELPRNHRQISEVTFSFHSNHDRGSPLTLAIVPALHSVQLVCGARQDSIWLAPASLASGFRLQSKHEQLGEASKIQN
jgi:hypothetical protein